MIHHGDCLEVLATLEANSIDACVTDPPYELDFMGKKWDGTGIAFRVELWREVLRVLKPGAHLLACGGTRTYHRMACAIEDAGFEVRDCLAWLYASGFPKSLNLGEGLGTALKPAHEPIVLARKPFTGTVRANVEKYGTGALRIDDCRIAWNGPEDAAAAAAAVGYGNSMKRGTVAAPTSLPTIYNKPPYEPDKMSGRWPANVALDDLAALVLDEMSGERVSGSSPIRHHGSPPGAFGLGGDGGTSMAYGDTGNASRFFYTAKPSREERDYGCSGLIGRGAGESTDRTDGSAGLNSPRAGAGRTGRAATGGSRNFHPT